MIKGTYIFYENGKEIYRSPNVITKFGKRFFTNFLAGNITDLSKDIAIGIDSTSATDNDTRLGFEFYRLPVTLRSVDIHSENETFVYSVVYKTTLPQDVAGEISEIGLYPAARSSINNYDSKFLTDFNDYLDWVDSSNEYAENATTSQKIGANAVRMSTYLTSPNEYKSSISVLDLSGYSVNDSIRLAYYKEDNNLASIKIRFYSSSTKYYEVTITPPSGTGYKISDNIPLSTVFAGAVGGPDKTQINQIGILLTPTSGNDSNVSMDALRINDEDTFDPIFGLISRSVLSTTLLKLAGRAVDIEYVVDLDFA